MFRKTVIALPAFLLVLTGVSGCTSLSGLPFGSAAGCAPASEVNSRFNTLLLASGMGLSESDLMDLDDGPFQTVSPSVINPPQLRRLLGQACVYESQDAAPGFEDGTAWFVVTNSEVEHTAVEGLVEGCSYPSEREAVSEFTDIVQDGAEFFGEVNGEISLNFAEIFPHAQYAALLQGC
ncbi:hypothetical protein FB468_0202 [Leucobacter komagatae]|uniref:DUF732 domain-containing protein n=1 Tax=Leucobacter komagatae TaxID=55969 RepID=A0A542Y2B5_9MICO|nr:hypothetical protein [Leucobacter komagatae]TQL42219.1 hypothetical protein FB468_0202 [Leucobacter komagatae]